MTSENCTITLRMFLDYDPSYKTPSDCYFYIKIEPQASQNYSVSYTDLPYVSPGIYYLGGPFSDDTSTGTWNCTRKLIFSGDIGAYKLTMIIKPSDWPYPTDAHVLECDEIVTGDVTGLLAGRYDYSHSTSSSYIQIVTLATGGGGSPTNQLVSIIEMN
jgi:hypothetical protein